MTEISVSLKIVSILELSKAGFSKEIDQERQHGFMSRL